MYIRAEGVGRAFFRQNRGASIPLLASRPRRLWEECGYAHRFSTRQGCCIFSPMFALCTMLLITLSLRSVNFSGFDPGILWAALVCMADGPSAS